MRTRGGILLANVITGLALGFTVTSIGFGDYMELNRMFTFQDLRMLLSFAGAVVIIVCVFALLRVRRTPGRIHAGVIPGAVLFGTGWAISGGCPAIPIIQVAAWIPARTGHDRRDRRRHPPVPLGQGPVPSHRQRLVRTVRTGRS